MAIIEVTVVPIGTKSTSLSYYVSEAIKILKKQKKVKYELTAMGTILEGDLDDLLSIVRKMHEKMFTLGTKRVVTSINIDDRRDKRETIEYKVKAVLNKIK